MKTSLTKLSSSLLFTLSFSVWAGPVAQVVDVSGSVFVVTPDGKTSALKVNQHIEEKSEIMVEEGASITLNDYFDAAYNLTGGSHIKFFNKSVQLKKGKTWIQSMSARFPLALTTANGYVDFWKGEFIATFDQATNKSQFLVVNGQVDVSNILDRNMKYTVASGEFSLIDPAIENGVPRAPTKVGLQSLNVALSEFKKLPEKMKTDPKREVASVTPEAVAPSAPEVKKGEIVFITSNRLPASVPADTASKYFKTMTKKAPANTRAVANSITPVKIRIFGTSYKETRPIAQPAAQPRTPASIKADAPQTKTFAPVMKNDPQFTESLKKHEQDQPKYTKELQNLIDDLKSY